MAFPEPAEDLEEAVGAVAARGVGITTSAEELVHFRDVMSVELPRREAAGLGDERFRHLAEAVADREPEVTGAE